MVLLAVVVYLVYLVRLSTASMQLEQPAERWSRECGWGRSGRFRVRDAACCQVCRASPGPGRDFTYWAHGYYLVHHSEPFQVCSGLLAARALLAVASWHQLLCRQALCMTPIASLPAVLSEYVASEIGPGQVASVT